MLIWSLTQSYRIDEEEREEDEEEDEEEGEEGGEEEK